jgi:phosphohistidine phosphatase
MLLYLLRHANADTVAARDDERALSEKGEAQARKVARFCEERKLRSEIILTSPLLRARQTAAPVGERLGVEVLVTPWLASGMAPDEAVSGLREYEKFSSVMLVGHEPDFSMLIAHLVGLADPAQFTVRKGSLTLLEMRTPRAGAATLHFTLPCRLM